MDHISWRAPEYTFNEKSTDWFWGLALSTLAIGVVSLIAGNFLLAVLIIIAAFTVGLLSIRRPKDIEFKINNRGVKAGTELHSWSGLESFWLEEETDPPKIILISKRFLMPHIIIPLGDVDFGNVHDVLLEHLPQVEHHESIVDVLAARLGF